MSIKDKINLFQKATAKVVYDSFVSRLENALVDDQWYSSAKELEEELTARGIVLSSKIYYEYKLPDNLKNYELDKSTLFLRCFPAIYENYLQSFTTKTTKNDLFLDATTTAKEDLSDFFGFCICLALSSIKNIQSVFEGTYISCKKQLDILAKQIWQLNPELHDIKDYKNFDFINGVIYGFAPKDIEFYIQQNRNNFDETTYQTTENMNKISNFIRKPIGYILSPKTSDDILKAIQLYQANRLHMHNQFNAFAID